MKRGLLAKPLLSCEFHICLIIKKKEYNDIKLLINNIKLFISEILFKIFIRGIRFKPY